MRPLTFLSLLAIPLAAVLGQTPAPAKAGDPAPNLVFTRIVSGGDPGGLFGHITVIGFFPAVSLNERLVTSWNQLIGKFAGQPVRFVWITSESEPALEPWLEKHPVSGSLLLDPPGATAQAYGVEIGGAIVDANGRVAGFTFMMPDEKQIRAVQEGRAIAIQGDASDSQLEAILAGRAVRLNAEPYRTRPEGKPDIPPSFDVRISPSKTKGTDENQGPEWWVLRGFGLKAVIAKVYDRDPSRIVLPEGFQNDDRYDFVLVPPQQMDPPEMHRMIQQAIEKHFHLFAAVETRPADVYVMTALAGKTPPAKTGDAGMGGGSAGWSFREFVVEKPHGGGAPTAEMIREARARLKFAAMSSIFAENTSMANFRRMLEDGLERPLVDETNMQGSYDLAVHGDARSTEEFLGMLRDQLGIVLTPGHRNIEMLVFHPLQAR